jgi:hypothetical protein
MYTACTFRLSQALELPFLMVIPRAFIFIALIAWIGTFIGLLAHLVGLERTVTDISSQGSQIK